ncbi:MAG: hypothetical protein AAFV54_04530 [Pseudomonadota bacterium]
MTLNASQLPETLILKSSRLKWFGLLALTAPLFASGVALVLIGDAGWLGWLGLIFFGACEAVFLYQLIWPGQLTLNEDGFEQVLVGRKLAHKWTDVLSFDVYGLKSGFLTTNQFVCFDRVEDDGKAVASINRALVGASAQLGDTFGMKAVELAALMNDFRARALNAR